MSDLLTHETFSRHANTKFRVQLEAANPVELELVEISELRLSPGQEQFALVFRGPNEMFLGQGGRSFEHDQMGQFELFIVPIRQDQQGYYYEAVFNRLRK